MRLSTLPTLAVLGGLLAAGIGAWWVGEPCSGDPLAELAAERGARPSPGRLTRLTEYAPWSPREVRSRPPIPAAVRPGPATRGGEYARFARLRRDAEREPSPANLQALATALLLAGETAAAVELLEQALQLTPGRSELWSDLSAAELAVFAGSNGAAAGGHAFAAVRALDAAERALTLRHDLSEALFNRALAQEILGLRRQAERDWRAVGDAEQRGDGWQREAAIAVERLERPTPAERWPEVRIRFLDEATVGDTRGAAELVAHSVAGSRDVAFELLGRWAKAAADGRKADEVPALTALRAIADRLAEGGRDWLLVDTVAEIEAAGGVAGAPVSPQRILLVSGLLAFDEARALLGSNRYDAARVRLETAEAALEAASSSFAGVVSHHLAIALFYGNDYDGAEALLWELRGRIDGLRHPALAALTARMIGLIRLNRADLGEPFGLWLEADRAFERAGDAEGEAGIDSFLASGYGLLGLTDQAWSHRLAALALLPITTSPRRAVALLGRAGDSAADAGEPISGLAFHDEAVAVAEARGGLLEQAVAWHSRGRVRAMVGDSAGARGDFAIAWAIWQQLEESDLKNSLAAEIHRSEGRLSPGSDPAEVIAIQSRAVEFFQAGPKRIFLAESQAARARAHLAAGDREAAEGDLRAALDEIESMRGRVEGEDNRIAFLDLERRQRILDDLLELVVDERPEEALVLVERGRARALLDRLENGSRTGTSPASPESAENALERLAAELPARTALVVFHALRERLLTWVVDHGGVRPPVVVAIGADELAARVGKLRDALRDHAAEERVRQLSGDLYDLLLRRPLAFASESDRLVVVPDKALHLVPYAVLWDRNSGHYLVETHTVSVAPSVRVHLRAVERSRSHGGAPAATILAIGDPELDRTLFPTLPPLPNARAEAAAVAALYPLPTILTGSRARRDIVLAEMGDHEVLHLATHGVVNPESIQGSALLMAPSGDGAGGALHAAEIAGLDLSRTRLAVLAACDTGTGAVRAGEGVVSLARAFLAAGVPAVVQSLWAIEDASTSELLAEFHRQVRSGLDPAAALRQAQLSFLSHEDPDRQRASQWGAMVTLGH